ncbi:hypothetical protein EHS25_005558 [Saitozyma podzolica]|uniref:Uncharacterized protein n=1 Tax=Saitozyma podzolica TaxID=1890683 RepID=A0A427XXP5_9TREE|nr:hypothetical protein EHS25_005558 [Saitozyma podzolica]
MEDHMFAVSSIAHSGVLHDVDEVNHYPVSPISRTSPLPLQPTCHLHAGGQSCTQLLLSAQVDDSSQSADTSTEALSNVANAGGNMPAMQARVVNLGLGTLGRFYQGEN